MTRERRQGRRVSIIIADDHQLMREGIRAALSAARDVRIVGEAATTDDAERLSSACKPDVLLLDLSMPGQPATEVVASLRQRCRVTQVIILSASRDPATMRTFVALGARGYVLKDDRGGAILDAIRSVMNGGTWYSDDIMTALLQPAPQPRDDLALTARELEVLKLLAEGLSDREIAGALSVSARTAEFHVGNILLKLGVRTRTQAALRAQGIQHLAPNGRVSS